MPRLTEAQFRRLSRPRAAKAAKKRKPPAQTEAQLLRAVLGWLAARKVFHWRANSGAGLRRGRGGRTVPVRANPQGTPDVLCVLPIDVGDGKPQIVGRLVGIECKAKGGRLRPSQAAWKANAERAGVLVLCVRTLGELIEAFASEGVN